MLPDFDETFYIDGFAFVCTCPSCPEQYDVYADGVRIGYVRLRFGKLTAEYPYPYSYPPRNIVYRAVIECGQHLKVGCGSFHSGQERMLYLEAIARTIHAAI